MIPKICRLSILIILLLFSIVNGSDFKRGIKISGLSDSNLKNYQISPSLVSAVTCTAQSYDSVAWAVNHWVIGNELYKAYLDPVESCDNPYPYVIEKVYMTIFTESACSLMISVDIESANLTDPLCPTPGALLNISSTYIVNIPASGLYQLETPLDSVCTVNEPFFAGFYFAGAVDTTWNIALVTDDNPAACVNYNIWDTTIGFVDLANTGYPEFPSFPGRILLFAGGEPGGNGSGDVQPSITIINPKTNDDITGDGNILAVETTGNDNIQSVLFQYRSIIGNWRTMATDTDGSRPLRNGIDPPGNGDGWSHNWDYSSLTEGTYWIQTVVADDLGQLDSDSVQVDIDPTPPAPIVINPTPMAIICDPMVLQIQSADENISSVKFERKTAEFDFELPVTEIGQAGFDNYYCGPIAAAIAIRYWFDQGYIFAMREGSTYIPIDTVVERLADNMQTKTNNGTYDDLFYYGLEQYNVLHNNALKFDIYNNPNYHLFRTLLQEQRELPILGLSGSTGLYVVGTGCSGLVDTNNEYTIKIIDPIVGSSFDVKMRDNATGSEIFYNDEWYRVDLIISIRGNNHYVTRDFIGYGSSDNDDIWSYEWTPNGLDEDSLYFITATVTDLTGRIETVSTLTQYQCHPDYLKGDYNNDGAIDINDVLYLSDYIYKDGVEPVGGAGRADANCNGSIDIADLVFIIKYLFEGGTEPCY